jgi:hypothetical protein
MIWNGKFWESRIMLPQVSTNLFDLEHFFIIEHFLDSNGNTVYGYPHIAPDLNATTSPVGIYANFTAGSNKVVCLNQISDQYVGAKLFTPRFPNGVLINSIDTSSNVITIASNATHTDLSVPLLFNLFRATFETNVNILDFDAFDSILGNIKLGNDYITTTADLSTVAASNYKILVTGNGIPLDARISHIDGNKVYLNKKCLATLTDVNISFYPLEESNNVSEYVYQYDLTTDPTLDQPVLNVLSDSYFQIDFDPSEILNGGVRKTSLVTSSSIPINIGLSSPDEGIFGRTLVIQDLSQGYPSIVARVEIHGETVGEDERLTVLLSNFGRKLNSTDAFIIRDSDPEEPFSDNIILNDKRKELLLEGHEIFPYIGSYKGLINAIKFFGYQDLRIKEYWLNIKKSDTAQTALQQNTAAVSNLKSQTQSQTRLIANILDDENSGKYKQVLVYGPNDDGTYGIQKEFEKLFPSSTYKKTSLFGLFYDINRVVPDQYDEFGYPITENAFVFSPEEVLLKLFALREKLKQDYLPISARIIDITGEGIYFGVYKQRLWVDNLKIDELHQGAWVDITSTPSVGYIEDLRPFGIREYTDLPYTPYVGLDPFTYSLSTYGNNVEPSPLNPPLSGEDSLSLAQAIDNFYYERNNSGIDKYKLGDDLPYNRDSDGSLYKIPAGFPTVLEISSFNLSWNDIDNRWDGLDRNYATYSTTTASYSDIPLYTGNPLVASSVNFRYDPSTGFGTLFNITLPTGKNFLNPTGGKLQLLFESTLNKEYKFLAELESYNRTTGNSSIKVLWSGTTGIFTAWSVKITNIGSTRKNIDYNDYSFFPDGFYSWNNLRFAGFYEIEWTVTKNDESPYKYQFRGPIGDYYRIPIILPYTGKYSVRCRVWDGFNDICTQFYPDLIDVSTRELEVVNVSRFNEAEVYSWDNSKKTWDDYNQPWEEVSENTPESSDVSNDIFNFANYGNQFNEGQECQVLTTVPSVLGTSVINIGVKEIGLTGFTSTYDSGIGPVLVTIRSQDLPHDFIEGEAVTIIDKNTSGTNYSGTYDIFNVTSTSFNFPFTITNSPDYSNIFLVKFGFINVSYEGKSYAKIYFSNSLGTTVANLTAYINKSNIIPAFGIETFAPTSISSNIAHQWYRILFHAPEGSGSVYNGKALTITTTGGLYVYDGINSIGQLAEFYFTGGVNSYNDYVSFDFNGNLINKNMINYGTKAITWDSFENLSWDNLYSNSWNSYDFHHDWLGGFSLYNVQDKDLIKVGINNPGIVISKNSSPDNSVGYLDLEEACKQLNDSKDPGISKFSYRVRGFSRLPDNFDNNENPIGEGLTTLAIPYNENTESYDVQYGSPGPGAPTSICQDSEGTLVMGGTENVKVFINPTSLLTYPISSLYPGSIPRKVKIDQNQNWWCYGEMCNVPLVIYNRNAPDKTILLSTAHLSYITNTKYNLILNLPRTSAYSSSPELLREFQIINLDFNTLNGNFAIYIKYQQIYLTESPDYIFSLIEYNSSIGEFVILSTAGAPFSPIKHYDIGSTVTYTGVTYESLTALNIGNEPSEVSTYWKKIDNKTYSYLDTSIHAVRQVKYEYIEKSSKLLVATNDGVKVYDGIKITSIDTNTCGINSNDVYSIAIDENNGKWIGTSSGICYYDNLRWGCWTQLTNNELPTGRTRNIIDLGHGRIFFTIQTGDSNYTLFYFNGVDFKVYNNDPGESYGYSPFPGMDYDYEDVYFVLNKYKYIDGEYTAYPGDVFYIGDSLRSGANYVTPGYWDFGYVGIYYDTGGSYLRKINYFVPYIHALAKNAGSEGWDFVYHITGNTVKDPVKLYEQGLGKNTVAFDFMVGPFSTSLLSGRNPQLPYSDKRSWRIPESIKADFQSIYYAHPNINPNDLFLNAPLRDIIDESASKESYWRNSNVARSEQVKSGNLINDFEWALTINSDSWNSSSNLFIDDNNFVYLTGVFNDEITLGSKNNMNPLGNVTLNSPGCQSIFLAKYNQAGVIQWARMYGYNADNDEYLLDYDYSPTGIKVDYLGNIIVVGFSNKTRYDHNDDLVLPNNLYLKWDWNANLILPTSLFNGSDNGNTNIIRDLAIDKNGDLYLAGEFTGNLYTGKYDLYSPTDTYGNPVSAVFAARIDGSGNIKWLNQIGTGGVETNVKIQIGDNYGSLYLTFFYTSLDYSTHSIYFSKYESYSFTKVFDKIIKNTSPINNFVSAEQHLSVSRKGEVALGVTFSGTLSVDGFTLKSKGNLDIAVFKMNDYKIEWAKSMGSTNADYCHDIGIDSLGHIFILGSYKGILADSPDYVSPNLYPPPVGGSDMILFKYDEKGTLIDVVSAGGLGNDEGYSISFDKSDNIYIAGYYRGAAIFGDWAFSPSGPQGGFLGKILNLKYKTGKNIGNPYSLFGSESLAASDIKITKREFEIPIGTPVIFNPIDSFIPGKNSHTWILTDDDSGKVIINVKNTKYFIWRFDTPGFYTLYLSVKDSNGNITEFKKNGYIRVINHKIAPPGETVKLVNSDTYRKRSLYEIGSNPQLV